MMIASLVLLFWKNYPNLNFYHSYCAMYAPNIKNYCSSNQFSVYLYNKILGDIMEFLLLFLTPFVVGLIGATMISKAVSKKFRKPQEKAVVGCLVFTVSFLSVVFTCFYIMGIMGFAFAR